MLDVGAQDGEPGGRFRHRSKAAVYSSTLTPKAREIFSALCGERLRPTRSIPLSEEVVIPARIASSGCVICFMTRKSPGNHLSGGISITSSISVFRAGSTLRKISICGKCRPFSQCWIVAAPTPEIRATSSRLKPLRRRACRNAWRFQPRRTRRGTTACRDLASSPVTVLHCARTGEFSWLRTMDVYHTMTVCVIGEERKRLDSIRQKEPGSMVPKPRRGEVERSFR